MKVASGLEFFYPLFWHNIFFLTLVSTALETLVLLVTPLVMTELELLLILSRL